MQIITRFSKICSALVILIRVKIYIIYTHNHEFSLFILHYEERGSNSFTLPYCIVVSIRCCTLWREKKRRSHRNSTHSVLMRTNELQTVDLMISRTILRSVDGKFIFHIPCSNITCTLQARYEIISKVRAVHAAGLTVVGWQTRRTVGRAKCIRLVS